MAINLKDVPDAVKAYVNTRVAVTVSAFTPSAGNSIQPNEKFTFTVTAANATPANGGINLKNIRYRIESASPAVAKFPVEGQPGGTATPLDGTTLPLDITAPAGAILITPAANSDNSKLEPGETDSIVVRGIAGSAPAGGDSSIRVRVLADVDLDQLFPRNEDTPVTSRTLHVEG
ncbi:MAG: hypothetical protein QOF02_1150 [Blastocatellia bacterium]|jgi:hypothetical protein|nr:hypothetical protein [Blastocatellia bacterium]